MQIEPWGPFRDNYHSASIAHILASVNRKPSSKAPPFQDFMWMDPEERKRLKEQRTVAFFHRHSKRDH